MKSLIKGPGALLLGELLFAVSFTLGKLSAPLLALTTLMWLRFLPALFLIPFFISGKIQFKVHQPLLMLFRCIVGVTSIVSLMYAIKWGHVGKANLIYACGTIWAFFGSIILFKERPQWKTYTALPLCLMGLWAIFQPTTTTFQKADLVALIGSFFGAWVYMSIKKLRTNHNPQTIIFCFYMVGLTLASLKLFSTPFHIPTLTGLLLGTAAAIAGFLAQLCMTLGFGHTPLTIAAFIKLTSTGLLVIIGALVFKDILTLKILTGLALLFASILIVTFYSTAKKEPLGPAPTLIS